MYFSKARGSRIKILYGLSSFEDKDKDMVDIDMVNMDIGVKIF